MDMLRSETRNLDYTSFCSDAIIREKFFSVFYSKLLKKEFKTSDYLHELFNEDDERFFVWIYEYFFSASSNVYLDVFGECVSKINETSFRELEPIYDCNIDDETCSYNVSDYFTEEDMAIIKKIPSFERFLKDAILLYEDDEDKFKFYIIKSKAIGNVYDKLTKEQKNNISSAFEPIEYIKSFENVSEGVYYKVIMTLYSTDDSSEGNADNSWACMPIELPLKVLKLAYFINKEEVI